jgi:phage tail protein X
MHIPMLDPKPHVVRRGDSLDAIAKAAGYRDWQVVYKSKCNSKLRAARPNPNLIQPGDIVMLPPRGADIRAALQARLERLKKVRQETVALFDSIKRQLESDFNKVESTGNAVDGAATVLNILRSVTKLCWKGYETLEMGAADLLKANKELAKEALELPKGVFDELTLKTFGDQLNDEKTVKLMNSVWMFSATVVRSWLDINSPSFWAGAVAEYRTSGSLRQAVTKRPADVYAEAMANLVRTGAAALNNVDSRIRETERLLHAVGVTVTTPLPLK